MAPINLTDEVSNVASRYNDRVQTAIDLLRELDKTQREHFDCLSAEAELVQRVADTARTLQNERDQIREQLKSYQSLYQEGQDELQRTKDELQLAKQQASAQSLLLNDAKLQLASEQERRRQAEDTANALRLDLAHKDPIAIPVTNNDNLRWRRRRWWHRGTAAAALIGLCVMGGVAAWLSLGPAMPFGFSRVILSTR